MSWDYIAKVIIIGDSGCGKSCLLVGGEGSESKALLTFPPPASAHR